MPLGDILKKVRQQAEQARQQEEQSKKASAETNAGTNINTVNADLAETTAALQHAVVAEHQLRHESTDVLGQNLVKAHKEAAGAFKKRTSKTEKPWYSVFCCCGKPDDDGEKRPLVTY